jgi:hypothetical protein
MNVSDTAGRNVFLREVTIADQNFFPVFDYKLVSPVTVRLLCSQPFTTVITRQMAQNLFGTD